MEDLQALARLGPGVERRVRAAVRAATLRTIEESTRVAWLPVDLNAELAEAVHAVAGARASREWARASFMLSLESFFRPLLEAVLALFDPTPASIYRFAPRVWTAVYRSCGELVTDSIGPCEMRVVLRGLPRPLRSDPFIEAVAGSCEATFALCKHEGTITVEPRDQRTSDASYLARWRPR